MHHYTSPIAAWFSFDTLCLAAPPKTGFTTLKHYFLDRVRSGPVPDHYHSVQISIRDPVTRFLSAYNHLVLANPHIPLHQHIRLHFGSAWSSEFWPDRVTDPDQHIERIFRLGLVHDLVSWRQDLHWATQASFIRDITALDDPRLVLFDYRSWPRVISRNLGFQPETQYQNTVPWDPRITSDLHRDHILGLYCDDHLLYENFRATASLRSRD